LGFDILADPANGVARAFGLTYAFPEYLKTIFTDVFDTRLPDWNGDQSWELPVPARYVVDRDGIIRYAVADPDYTVRPEPDETLAAVRSLVV
jgi:peroxiredoxin